MRNAINFQTIALSLPGALAGIVECRDCGQVSTIGGAITHGWRTVDRELGSDVYVTDYVCADCCEARVHDYNQLVADQANDL